MTRPAPANSTVTITLSGEGLRRLQDAVVTAGPTTIVRLAVDTDPQPDDPAVRPVQYGRFKIGEGTWSPPFYADAVVTAPAYDTEESQP